MWINDVNECITRDIMILLAQKKSWLFFLPQIIEITLKKPQNPEKKTVYERNIYIL